MGRLLYSSILIILTLFGVTVFGNEDTVYTDVEKISLKQFREMVSDLLYMDFHHEDKFLITWLRAANLDLNRAKELMATSFKWRKENGIDAILHDPLMIKFEKIFPYSLESVDKEGSPILHLPFKAWDLRKTYITGKGKDLTHYLDYLFEKGTEKIRDLANSTQSEVTQAILLVDMHGYNVRQHACLGCLTFYVDLIQHYDRHYPYGLKSVILINTIPVFDNLLQILRPIIPPYMQKRFFVYGLNKAEWSQALLRTISADQLPLSFGGTKGKYKFSGQV